MKAAGRGEKGGTVAPPRSSWARARARRARRTCRLWGRRARMHNPARARTGAFSEAHLRLGCGGLREGCVEVDWTGRGGGGGGGGVHVSTDLRGSSRPARGRRGAVAPAPAFSWWRARDRRVKLMDRTRPLASPPGRSIPRAHESALGREGRARGGMARAARPTSAGRFLQQQFTIVWPFRLQGSELDTGVSCRITHGCLLRTSGRPHFLSNASRMSPTCSSSAPT